MPRSPTGRRRRQHHYASRAKTQLQLKQDLGEMYVMATVSDTATGLTGWYDAPNGERLYVHACCRRSDEARDAARRSRGRTSRAVPAMRYKATILEAIAGHPYGPDLNELAPLDPAG